MGLIRIVFKLCSYFLEVYFELQSLLICPTILSTTYSSLLECISWLRFVGFIDYFVAHRGELARGRRWRSQWRLCLVFRFSQLWRSDPARNRCGTVWLSTLRVCYTFSSRRYLRLSPVELVETEYLQICMHRAWRAMLQIGTDHSQVNIALETCAYARLSWCIMPIYVPELSCAVLALMIQVCPSLVCLFWHVIGKVRGWRQPSTRPCEGMVVLRSSWVLYPQVSGRTKKTRFSLCSAI